MGKAARTAFAGLLLFVTACAGEPSLVPAATSPPAPAETPAPVYALGPSPSPTPRPTPSPDPSATPTPAPPSTLVVAPSPPPLATPVDQGSKAVAARPLSHTEKDAEFILPWAAVGKLCPDTLVYRRFDAFVRRGHAVQVAPNETLSLASGGPVDWMSSRLVRMEKADRFRSLAVEISYFEQAGAAEALVRERARQADASLRDEGGFVVAVWKSQGPTAALAGWLAGNNLALHIGQAASGDVPRFCDTSAVLQLLDVARVNMSAVTVTSPPPGATATAPPAAMWTESKRVDSREAGPPVRVPEGQFYNHLWFDKAPAVQRFSFVAGNPWRVVLEIQGAVGTRYELRVEVRQPGRQTQEVAEVFELQSPSATLTRPDTGYGDEPGEAGSVQITLSFDAPLQWNARIEEMEPSVSAPPGPPPPAPPSPPAPPLPPTSAPPLAPPPPPTSGPQATAPRHAADFEVTLYQGRDTLGWSSETGKLSDLWIRDSPVVLNFWAGQLPPSRTEMPAVQAVYEQYMDRVQFLGLDVGPFVGLGSLADGRALVAELKVGYPTGTTSNPDVVRSYNLVGLPATYFVKPGGEVHRTWAGVLTTEKLAELVAELVAASSGQPK